MTCMHIHRHQVQIASTRNILQQQVPLGFLFKLIPVLSFFLLVLLIFATFLLGLITVYQTLIITATAATSLYMNPDLEY